MPLFEKLYTGTEDIRRTFDKFKDYPQDEFVDKEERIRIFNKLKSAYLDLDKNDNRFSAIDENSLENIDNSLINKRRINSLKTLVKWSLFFEISLYVIILSAIITTFVFVVLNYKTHNIFTWNDADIIVNVFIFSFKASDIVEYLFYFQLVSFLLVAIAHTLLISIRYNRYVERYIVKGESVSLSRRSVSLIGYLMTTSLIKRYENNVTGLVYLGAGFLVIIVGLRGIGNDLVTKLGIPFPPAVLAENQGIANWLIFFALAVEFSLLVLLALFTFFKDEGEDRKDNQSDRNGGAKTQELSVDNFKELLRLSHQQPLKVDFSELEGQLATLNTNLAKGLIYRDRENPKETRSYLDDINRKMEFDNLKKVFTSGLQELSSIDPSNVSEFSSAVEKISISINGIASRLNENKLQEQLISFNKTIMEIKQTLGVKFNDGNNGNKPITNQ